MMADFPKLSILPSEVFDTGTLRYGDGFITAEFLPMKKVEIEVEVLVEDDKN